MPDDDSKILVAIAELHGEVRALDGRIDGFEKHVDSQFENVTKRIDRAENDALTGWRLVLVLLIPFVLTGGGLLASFMQLSGAVSDVRVAVATMNGNVNTLGMTVREQGSQINEIRAALRMPLPPPSSTPPPSSSVTPAPEPPSAVVDAHDPATYRTRFPQLTQSQIDPDAASSACFGDGQPWSCTWAALNALYHQRPDASATLFSQGCTRRDALSCRFLLGELARRHQWTLRPEVQVALTSWRTSHCDGDAVACDAILALQALTPRPRG